MHEDFVDFTTQDAIIQRSGRCGREGRKGRVVRLFSEERFKEMKKYKDSEIETSNIDLAILKLFEGIKDNIYYIIVQSFIIFGQIILVTFGGRAVRTQPLSILQHIYCILIASLSLVVGFLVKLIPIDMNEKVSKTKEEIEEEIDEEKIKKERNLKTLTYTLIPKKNEIKRTKS